MYNKKILDELQQIVSSFVDNEDAVKIEFNTRLIEDLNFDSIKIMTLISEIEKKFGVEFSDEFLLVENLDSIANIYYFLEEHSKK